MHFNEGNFKSIDFDNFILIVCQELGAMWNLVLYKNKGCKVGHRPGPGKL